jgi:D-lactate dehydrogenase
MQRGVFIINTGRGPLVDTPAAIRGLKSGRIGALAIDVYEEEEGVFYEDLSGGILADDQLARLLTFPNVLVTSHQAFFTREAILAIAHTTIDNLDDFAAGRPCPNALKA